MRISEFKWKFLLDPRTVILLVAIFNYFWFFSGSSFVHHLGSSGTKISFCGVCPWYWDWSLTNLPSLSLMAAVCLLLFGWKGQLAAILISGYELFEGFRWMSAGSGVFDGILRRLEIIASSDMVNIWELLDIQYLFALIVFITASAYLVKGSIAERRTVNSLG